jgi:hypothetical protein
MNYEKAWHQLRESNRAAIALCKSKSPNIIFKPVDKNDLMLAVLNANEKIFDDIEKECKQCHNT